MIDFKVPLLFNLSFFDLVLLISSVLGILIMIKQLVYIRSTAEFTNDTSKAIKQNTSATMKLLNAKFHQN